MILKASQRGGGKQLALHLLRTDENEHVEVHEVSGFVSQDVTGAMKEAYAVSRGTKAKQFLFSVSLSPPPTERVSIETFENAIERIEQANGLTGQPRIVVFHEKEGRRHCHAVWSRIDAETMTARPLPFFKMRLREISKEIYLEQGWKMPRGLMDSREADPRNFTLEEYQQAKREGLPPRDLKQAVQECWAVSDSKQGFASALEERGLRLARGDRRGFVAVTSRGGVLSLTRYLGRTAKELADRLGEAGKLRSVEETKALIAAEMTPAMERFIGHARARFETERSPLEAERRRMAASHRAERALLDAAQRDRWEKETRDREARARKGLAGILDRVTGRARELRRGNERDALEALKRDRDQRHALLCAQFEERAGLQSRLHELRARHSRETLALHHDLARLRRGDIEALPGERDAPGQPTRKAELPRGPRMTPRVQERLEALRSVSPEKRTTRQFEDAARNTDRLNRLREMRAQPADRRGPTREL